jgi:glycosyltransferase involved in cell wall biosynthesis
MNKLSIIILTKNAEDVIADCIDSVAFADEIVVIDSLSTDRTVDIAKMKGAKITEYEFKSFAEKRNAGLRKAKSEWVFYIDADERVTEELQAAINKDILEAKKPEFNAYKVQRKNFYLGNHEWPVIEQMERVFRAKALHRWVGELHETPEYDGEIGTFDGFLLHYTHQNLSSMLQKTIAWSGIEAQLRFDANHPKMTWWRFPRVMLSAFYDSYIKQKGYTVGTAGLIESMYQGFSMFVTYARLWELQQRKK